MKRENKIVDSIYLRELSSVFKSNKREKAFELSAPILKAVSGDRTFFDLVIKENLSKTDFLNSKRDYEKLLKFSVHESKEFNLVLNIFPPAKKNERLSAKSIHHHNNLLLATINTFGPGYESFLFKKNIHIDRKTMESRMELDEIYFHGPDQLKIIDSFVPHVVFFPESVTATYALWTYNKQRKIERFKGYPIIESVKPLAVKMINAIKLGKLLELNDVSEVYFYVKNGRIYLLDKKLMYPEGTNESFLRNMFCFLKETGFSDMEFLRSLIKNKNTGPVAARYIKKYIAGEHYAFSFEDAYSVIPEENMNREDILNALNAYKTAPINSEPILNSFENGF